MIVLADTNEAMVQAWMKYFPAIVPIFHRDIFAVQMDTLISPGNSSGSMTGGLDGEIARRWPYLDPMVRDKALMGVGEAVPFRCKYAGDCPFTYLLYTPTMPGARDISDTNNVYLAMKAIMRFDGLLGVMAIPGLGTGVGKMPVEEAAKQMFAAYEEAK